MRDYRDNGRGSGRGGRGNDRSYGGGRRERQMFDTTCDNCGKNCQVPFRPTGEKPVYCSSCFEENGGNDRGRNDRRGGGRGGSYGRNDRGGRSNSAPSYKKDFQMLNEKLDAIYDLLLSVTTQESAEAVVDELVTEMPVEVTEEPAKEEETSIIEEVLAE